MIENRCRNLSCQFRTNCPFLAAPSRDSEESVGKSIAMPSIRDPSPTRSFEVREETVGRVGILAIEEKITSCLLPAVDEARSVLPGLQGLYLYLSSPGGDGNVARRIQRLVLAARSLGIPVLACGNIVCSVALEIGILADRFLLDSVAIVGGFGACFHYCVGQGPQVLVSPQSPKKAVAPDVDFLNWGTPPRGISNRLHNQYEDSIFVVALSRKCSVEELRQILDGRVISAREAVKRKLADGLMATEPEGYEQFLTLVKNAHSA